VSTAAHPPAQPEGYQRIVNSVALPVQPDVAFTFVTNAARWSRWHPATRSVSGVPDRPLVLGETVREAIAVGARRFEAVWTVRVCEPPSCWVIDTRTARGDARIEYQLAPDGSGCRFTRTLWFRSRALPWKWLDGTLMRWVLARNSAAALARLQVVLATS
jgi:Polyketide cyclase / dehydrase and lipid transport